MQTHNVTHKYLRMHGYTFKYMYYTQSRKLMCEYEQSTNTK